jgi:hypothetical protein
MSHGFQQPSKERIIHIQLFYATSSERSFKKFGFDELTAMVFFPSNQLL